MSPVNVVADGAVALLVGFLVFYLLYYGVAITLYILGSLGLYTIAKRREIKHPWMAWVPVLSFWTLGSVSDQYQYVTKGKVCNKGKWLIGLMIAMFVLVIAVYVIWFKSLLEIGMNAQVGYFDDTQMVQKLLISLGSSAVVTLVCSGVGIALTVVEYVCYYHLFASCEPENKGLYLVLGILFSFLMPIFTFVCRNKDLGMPPRRDEPAAYIPQPVYEMPQQAEPWSAPEDPNN